MSNFHYTLLVLGNVFVCILAGVKVKKNPRPKGRGLGQANLELYIKLDVCPIRTITNNVA
jgi:hypothetical protein